MTAALLLWLSLAPARAADPAPYFKGESCLRCHVSIRDAADPGAGALEAPEEHDVVVVGGGIAGLAAAYELRGRDVLVLEKEDEAGGKVRRQSWGTARYPVAAGYMAQIYIPRAAALLKDLGLEAVAIPEPGNSLLVGVRVVHDPLGAGLERAVPDAGARKRLRALSAELVRLSKDPRLGEAPPVPARLSRFQRELDRRTLREYLTSRFGPEAGVFGDRYSLSLFGVSAEKVSAWAGLVFMSADFGATQNITWEGGPGVLSERLVDKIGPARVRTGALVLRVEQDEDGVTAVYEREGRLRRVRARRLVMAVPSFVARRLIRGLPRWKDEALKGVRYSSYAVAVVAADKPLYRESFDLWTGTSTIFTDLEPADWGRTPPPAAPGSPAQVLEAFIPLGESEGRARLLNSTDDELAARVGADLETVFPGARGVLHGIRIVRWGHAMPIMSPRFLTEKREAVERRVGRIVFAGVDSQLPCIEGALASGWRAADELTGIKP